LNRTFAVPRRRADPGEDPDPYLGTAAICARYSVASRTWYRVRALFPPCDISLNGRQLWRRSTLERFDAEQKSASMAQAREAVDHLREFVTTRAVLSKSESVILEKLLAAATRMEPPNSPHHANPRRDSWLRTGAARKENLK
jgi:hypothetical protein